jgi:hypothetical protein
MNTGTSASTSLDCPCKRIPLSLSSFTAAEFGDLGALKRKSSETIWNDSVGYTPLHLAAQHGHVAATVYLLEKINVNSGLGCSATPLHRASFSGAIGTMRLLLNRSDCDLLAKDISCADYRTPLHKAIAGGRYLAVHLLLTELRSRTESNETFLHQALRAVDCNQQTPLQLARSFISKDYDVERSSVARWDAVAGGPPNWTRCFSLLEQAHLDSLNSRTNDSQYGKENDTQASSLTLTQLCVDCESSDRSCATATWELAFRTALQMSLSTSLPLQSVTSTNGREVLIPDTDEVNASFVGSNDAFPIPMHKTANNAEHLGRACENCGRIAVVLYPLRDPTAENVSFICHSCHRTYQNY